MFKHITRLRSNRLLRLNVSHFAYSFTDLLDSQPHSLEVIQHHVPGDYGPSQPPLGAQILAQTYSQSKSQLVIESSVTDERKAKIAASFPDYKVPMSDMARMVKVDYQEDLMKTTHPLEIGAAERREATEYKGKVEQNQLLLFNIPGSLTEENIKKLISVNGVIVEDFEIKKAITDKDIAYVKVTLQHPRQVKVLKNALYNTWIEDKKIKVKDHTDLVYETYNNRTIVARNLPLHYKTKQLEDIFGSLGAVVDIELPMKDAALEQHLKDKIDSFQKQRQVQNELERRRAQIVVRESIERNEEYQQILTSFLGEERAQQVLLGYQQVGDAYQGSAQKQLEMAEESRKLSLHNIITQLQSESTEVRQAKNILERLKGQIDAAEVPGIQSQSQPFKAASQDDKNVVTNLVKYLNRNRESVDTDTLASLNNLIYKNNDQQLDPLQQLEQLSRSELALAYDNLLECLNDREELIQRRIQSQISHSGIKERILIEGKDWARELEDVPSVNDHFNQDFKAEDFLSASEQVRNVLRFKNMTPEQKLYQLITRTFNPFESPNFNINQLHFVENQALEDYREQPKPDPKQTPTMARLMYPGAPLKPEVQEIVDQKVEELRNKFDMPFDELYHKEKKLIDQVVKAEKALKDKERTLANPMPANTQYNPSELPPDLLAGTGMPHEHQFIRDQRIEQEKLLKEQIDNKQGSASYDFLLNDENEMHKLIQEGVFTQQEYDAYLKIKAECNKVNLGYAFITYSHTDEAKMALLMTTDLKLPEGPVETFLKGKVDHGDLDPIWTLNKLKNDAQLVDEMKNLREAKQELRDFEKNLDQDLPSLKRLQEFRKLARDHIENKPYDTRKTYARTPEEEEKVNEMIRKLQKENPDIDYTQLFDTKRAEDARKVQHKKAFASYKAFQFLKHGVEFQAKLQGKQQQDSQPQNKLQAADPYGFPPFDETVAQFLTKDKFPRVLKRGDTLDRPGRKFEYTEQDFVEAYFGKDFTKLPSTEVDTGSPVFGYNESLKKKFPIDKYLQLPLLNSQQKVYHKHFTEIEEQDPGQDIGFKRYLENVDEKELEEKLVLGQDKPHPTEPNRSLLTDMEKKLENYFKRREKLDPENPLINPREIQAIKDSVYEEYYPGQQPEPEETDPKKRYHRPKVRVDPKQTQKFEPFYENGEQQNDPQSSPQDDNMPPASDPVVENAPSQQAQQQTHGKGPRRDFRDQRRQQYQSRQYEADRRTGPAQPEEPEEPQQKVNPRERINLDGTINWKVKADMMATEKDLRTRQSQQRSLNDYAKESDSEREEEDIYNHYINQMNKAKKERESDQRKMTFQEAQAQKQTEQLENMFPETPRFEGFFKSMASGKHPFEEDKYKFDEQAQQTEEQHKADQEYDEELYQRELRGRLMGEKLTPRQFGTLFRSTLDDENKILFERDELRQQFITKRDIAAAGMELLESYRRRMVLDGKWTEAESHVKLREECKKIEDAMPSTREEYRTRKELEQNMAILQQTINPKTLYEKEYYFDEGLGESVKEHAQKIKEQYPELEVLIRRDRDGYAIVKTIYKPKYKYNLDEIANFNPLEGKNKVKESIDEILKHILPGVKEAGADFSKLDKETLQKSIKLLMPYSEDNYDLDSKSQAMFDQLMKERFSGRFKDDKEGFAKAFFEMSDKLTYDPNKKLNPTARFDEVSGLDVDGIIKDFEDDKDVFMREIAEQVTLRVKEHMLLKERKSSDFVKPRRSEESIFAAQQHSYDKGTQFLQQENRDLLNAGDKNEGEFDKEAYQQLKAEIKRRREAKERLLKQGFPELKPYVHI